MRHHRSLSERLTLMTIHYKFYSTKNIDDNDLFCVSIENKQLKIEEHVKDNLWIQVIDKEIKVIKKRDLGVF